MTLIPRLAATLLAVAIPGLAWAQESEAELAKKLANPISDLISVPFQNNYDCCYGPADGYRYTLNVQPVIPIGISEHWNMISRTIVPIRADDVEPSASTGRRLGYMTSPLAPLSAF